jgi:hypothetical protein
MHKRRLRLLRGVKGKARPSAAGAESSDVVADIAGRISECLLSPRKRTVCLSVSLSRQRKTRSVVVIRFRPQNYRRCSTPVKKTATTRLTETAITQLTPVGAVRHTLATNITVGRYSPLADRAFALGSLSAAGARSSSRFVMMQPRREHSTEDARFFT